MTLEELKELEKAYQNGRQSMKEEALKTVPERTGLEGFDLDTCKHCGNQGCDCICEGWNKAHEALKKLV